MQKKKILITTIDEGHKSIADAIAQDLKSDYHVKVSPDNLFRSYTRIYSASYKYFPQILTIPYYILEKEPFYSLGMKQYKKHIYPYVENELKTYQPDLIISTYFGFNDALTELSQISNIPIINIVTDPVTPHFAIFDSQNINCIFDAKLATLYPKQLPSLKYHITGWFTNQKYYKTNFDNDLNKQFDFNPDIFTILICGGSEGMNAILKIFPALLLAKTPIQIIAVCGHNRQLFNFLTQAVKFHDELPNRLKRPLKIKVLGYTKQMSQLMAMSDLIVGKAGPNLLFEAVASSKPFFAISHLPGQEEGNIDLIKDEKLGYVEENPYKASKLLMQIIKNPQELEEFKAPIAQMRAYNQQAPEKLKQLIKEML